MVVPVVFAGNSVLLGMDISSEKVADKTHPLKLEKKYTQAKVVSYNEPLLVGISAKDTAIEPKAAVVSHKLSKNISQPKVAKKVSFRKPSVIVNGNFKKYEVDGRVEFKLSPGLLKPQVVELLLNHHLIDSEDDIQWLASSNFAWPNSHIIKGKSLDHVLNAVLKPYRLVSVFKGNGSVVISKL